MGRSTRNMDNLSETKAKLLKKETTPCNSCSGRGPLVVIMKKTGDCGCQQPDELGREPLQEKPVSEAKHSTSPFAIRCIAAVTGGKASSKEELSGAFAKCNATKNKSDHDLDAGAKSRPGFKSRKAEFVKALNSVKNKRKNSGK